MTDERLEKAMALEAEYKGLAMELDEAGKLAEKKQMKLAVYISNSKPAVMHCPRAGSSYGLGRAIRYDILEDRLWASFETPAARCIPGFSSLLENGELKILSESFEKLNEEIKSNKADEKAYSDALFEKMLVLEKDLKNLGFRRFDEKGRALDQKAPITEGIFMNADGFCTNGKTVSGETYNLWGYDYTGYTKDGFDKDGYDHDGYAKDGYNREGFNKEGYNREGYKIDGYNREGFNRLGFKRDGISNLGTRYNAQMRDSEGNALNYFTESNDGAFLRGKKDMPAKTFAVSVYVPNTADIGNKNLFSESERKLSDLIYQAKSFSKNLEKARTDYNKLMAQALTKLIWQENITGTVHVVCVPSSKTLRSSKKDSFERNFVETAIPGLVVPGCEIVDDKDLLLRAYDIEASHIINDHSFERQYESIRCGKEINEDDCYIVIDDITTSGSSFLACDMILVNNGAKQEKIYNLALMVTRDKYSCDGDPFAYYYPWINR